MSTNPQLEIELGRKRELLLMSGSIESVAVFRQRCREIGMSIQLLADVTAAGYDTMGSFAYGCSFVPGASDESQLVAFARRVNNGAELNEEQMAKFRRMFFESFTMAQADLKLRLERSEDSLPRRLAVPERAARYNSQVARLPGLCLRGELECSDALIDEAMSQFDDNRLRHIPWEKCTRKIDEVSGVKKLEVFQKSANGMLKASEIPEQKTADVSDDYALRNALTRRALAYDQASLLTFSVHEEWTSRMFSARTKQQIPGYSRVSYDQLHRADLAMFTRLAELTREGIVPEATVRPLDRALRQALNETEVVHLLNPLPSLGTGRNSEATHGKRLLQDDSEWNQDESKKKKGEKQQKGKGKGKKGGAKQSTQKTPGLPEGLSGSSRTKDGSHICFAYNYGKCDQNKKGCQKGKHCCTKCFQEHSFIGSSCASVAT